MLLDGGISLSSFDEARLRDLDRRFGRGGDIADVRSAIENAFGSKMDLGKKNIRRDVDLFLKRYYR
jgi:hypothetical protein